MKEDRPRASREAIRKMAETHVRSSAKLEGRVVPDGFVRSKEVQSFLDDLKLRRSQEKQ